MTVGRGEWSEVGEIKESRKNNERKAGGALPEEMGMRSSVDGERFSIPQMEELRVKIVELVETMTTTPKVGGETAKS